MDQATLRSVEQSLLVRIESEKQNVFRYLQTCPLGAHASVMEPWIGGLDGFAWSFQQMAPVADWLARQGLPQAEQFLNTLFQDLSTARQQYIAMYQGMIQTQTNLAAIWQDSVNFATRNILAATRYSNAVFQRWQTDYFDVTEERCFACHQVIGVPGGGYHYECARRLGLI